MASKISSILLEKLLVLEGFYNNVNNPVVFSGIKQAESDVDE